MRACLDNQLGKAFAEGDRPPYFYTRSQLNSRGMKPRSGEEPVSLPDQFVGGSMAFILLWRLDQSEPIQMLPDDLIIPNHRDGMCQICREYVAPGRGRLVLPYTNRIEHNPATASVRHLPGECTKGNGWIYFATGGGPANDLIKIGMTARHPRMRTGEVWIFHDGKNRSIKVWAAPTTDRRAAERRAHGLLAEHRVHWRIERGRFGREVVHKPDERLKYPTSSYCRLDTEMFAVSVEKAIDAVETATGQKVERIRSVFLGYPQGDRVIA